MKILCIADIHGNVEKIENIKDLNPDLILVAGDITNFGGKEKAKEVIKALKNACKNILAVPGNCDYPEVLDLLEEMGISIHGKGVKIDNRTGIFGVGGSNITPFNTPFELEESEIVSLLEAGYKAIKDCKIKILVSHAPPFGILDKISSGLHVGSKAISEFLKENKVDYVVCGHIHEAKGIEKVDEITFINPSEFYKGCFLLDSETGKIEEISF